MLPNRWLKLTPAIAFFLETAVESSKVISASPGSRRQGS
jgi:hypothetical protein